LLSKQHIETLLDDVFLRPIANDIDDLLVKKKQLVALVKVAYEAGVRDACGLLRDTPQPSFGDLIAQALEVRLLGASND
jgi:hypothetical protein